jgi:hypothetical protein
MICSEAIENSIKNIEGTLSRKKEKVLIEHLESCNECRGTYNLIAANYDAELPAPENGGDIASKVMDRINPDRYSGNKRLLRKGRIVLALAGIFLAGGAVLFADDIYYSLKKLIRMMEPGTKWEQEAAKAANDPEIADPDREVQTITGIEEAIAVYKENRKEVLGQIHRLAPGRGTAFTVTGKGSDVDVRGVKLLSGRTIVYFGLRDGTGTYDPEYPYLANPLTTFREESAVQNAIGENAFTVLPSYLPDGYNFDQAVIKDGKIQELVYRRGDRSIQIELRARSAYSFGDFENSLLTVHEKQAVLSENGSGRKVLHLFLGKDVHRRFLAVSVSAGINEPVLTRIAEGLQFYNTESNGMDSSSYLAGVKDERVLDAWDTIAEKEMSEAGMFNIILDDEGDVRFSKTDAGPGGWCSISYLNKEYGELKPVLNYPVMMYGSVYSAYRLAAASVSFRPYEEQKTVRYSLVRKEDGTGAPEHDLPDRISVQAHGLPREAARFPKEEVLLLRYAGSPGSRLVRDTEGELYLIHSTGIIDTVRKQEERYVLYSLDYLPPGLDDTETRRQLSDINTQ